MTDRNQSDLDREQRGSSNPNQNPNDRTEGRSTKQGETDRMGGTTDTENLGVGESNRNPGNESEGAGNRSTGNIEGDENLNRR